MCETKIEIENYSLQELYDVMESIDRLPYKAVQLDVLALLLDTNTHITHQLEES